LRAYKRFTDQEIINSALEYMTKFPNAGRYKVILNTLGNESRIRDLEKQGLVKLPTPEPRGKAWRRSFTMYSKPIERATA